MKRLLATTALSAAGLALTIQPSLAAEQIKLGVGGYFNAFIVAASQDDGTGQAGANRRSHKIAREGEIVFSGKSTLDNGITFGVNVQLEAETCADQIDESYMFVEGKFGRVIIGSEDPATDNMFYGAPVAIAGVGLDTPDDLFTSPGANAVATPVSIVNISGDSEKVTYFTPRFAGFQLGLSYTPENCQEVGGTCGGTYSGFSADNNAGQQSEIVEIAANYSRSFGAVDVNVYGGYANGDLEVAAVGAEDQKQWGIGGQVGFAGFTLGGSYKEDNLATSGSNTDRTDYAVGLSYATGPWTVGAAYAYGEVEAGAGLGEDEVDGYQVGAQYALGPGITLTGGITYWDFQDNLNAPGAENQSTEFVIGTLIEF